MIQVDEDSVTLLPGFCIRDVDASEIHPLEVLISVTHGEVIIDLSFWMENVEVFLLEMHPLVAVLMVL